MTNDLVTNSNVDNYNYIVVLKMMIKMIVIVTIGYNDDSDCNFLWSERWY